ncbi:hypothetical protein [Ureibacillus manganicus]|uniref:Transcriptional regulator n=1 Tax=Ureibacillus manganicus DSM 26584 TaxID=1384049 RepID=A0A0A3I5U5_9BACL|nr:hypothetical protein [Ureibacillus manganicus]KGR78073.1 hypothetical protein CD29_13045 [Ureibacillus manganicus DSM 26584]
MSNIIAVIGSPTLIEKIKALSNTVPEIEFQYFSYGSIFETKTIIEEVSTYIDTFLFTGIIPYKLAQEQLKRLNKTGYFLDLDEYSIALGIFKAIQEKQDIRFSIDYTSNVNLDTIFADLNIDPEKVYKVDGFLFFEDEGDDYGIEIAKFHERLLKENKIQKIITCLSSVSNYLKERGIEHIRITHSTTVILNMLNIINTQSRLEETRAAQTIIAKFKIQNYESEVSEKGTYYVESNILELNRILLEIANNTFSTLQRNNSDEFTLYGTYGSFINFTRNMTDFSFIDEIEKLVNIPIGIGFGTGYTTKDAENNAMQALGISIKTDELQGYLITQKGEIIGPLEKGMYNPDQTNNDSQNNWIIRASESGINKQTLKRIYQFDKLNEFKGFTSAELSEYILTSKRSAERFIKVLLEEGFIQETGHEITNGRGRPSKIYKLKYE